MTSHALYWWHHMHYIWHAIYCVWYYIYFMCDITQCLYLWHCTLSVYDISRVIGTIHSVMTTQQVCNFTATMSDITPTVSVSSHRVDQLYNTQCMCDIRASMCMTSYALHVTSRSQFRTSGPLYVWHQVHSIWPHFHCISVITPTLSMISQPLYVWPHIQYICDITSTIFMT